MVKIKLILVVSLLLNLLFIFGGTFVVAQKGGASYLKDKIVSVFDEGTTTEFTPYYHDRNSIFEELTIDSDDIVMIGDSLTDGNEWSESFGNENIKNRGINADTTAGVLNRLDSVIKGKPAKLLLLIGVNDFDFGLTEDEILKNYQEIIGRIQAETPNTEVYLQSLLPVNEELNTVMPGISNEQIMSLNSKLKAISEDHEFNYIDLYSLLENDNQLDIKYTNDGIHLNSDGYGVWENVLRDKLQ